MEHFLSITAQFILGKSTPAPDAKTEPAHDRFLLTSNSLTFL